MLKAKTTYSVDCPKCGKTITMDVDFNGYEYKIIDKPWPEKALVVWEGQCVYCYEWIYFQL